MFQLWDSTYFSIKDSWQFKEKDLLQNIENSSLNGHTIFAFCGTGACQKKSDKDIFPIHEKSRLNNKSNSEWTNTNCNYYYGIA